MIFVIFGDISLIFIIPALVTDMMGVARLSPCAFTCFRKYPTKITNFSYRKPVG